MLRVWGPGFSNNLLSKVPTYDVDWAMVRLAIQVGI